MSSRGISLGGIIAIAITGLFLTVLTSGLITSSQLLPNEGSEINDGNLVDAEAVTNGGTVAAVNVGVYKDAECTQNYTSVDWGTLTPGNEKNETIYIKNNGAVPATLSMTTDNWNPGNADAFLNLTWDRADYVLGAGESILAVLTLTVSPSVAEITDFSFNIIITGKN